MNSITLMKFNSNPRFFENNEFDFCGKAERKLNSGLCLIKKNFSLLTSWGKTENFGFVSINENSWHVEEIDSCPTSLLISYSSFVMGAPSEGCYKKAGFVEPFSERALIFMGAECKKLFAPSRALRSKYPKYEDKNNR